MNDEAVADRDPIDIIGETEEAEAEESHDEHHHESYREQSGEPRSTAPMQSFTMRQVGLGAVILAVGVAIAYLVPLILA